MVVVGSWQGNGMICVNRPLTRQGNGIVCVNRPLRCYSFLFIQRELVFEGSRLGQNLKWHFCPFSRLLNSRRITNGYVCMAYFIVCCTCIVRIDFQHKLILPFFAPKYKAFACLC
jgi:hypothetical protein